jgi:hypothetical protein
MDIKVKMNKGCFYRNDIWFSSAYLSLSISSRDLLQCLVTEINKAKIKGKWVSFRNGELSFIESDYIKLTKRSKQTYINARNQLIQTGFIKMTHRGGNGAGDRAMYRVLIADDVRIEHQRWRKYPEQNWTNKIPKSRGLTIGKETRFKKGQSARKVISHPIELDPKV